MKAINLKTEYLQNPIGIDILQPRFFWNCDIGTCQTAYQIVATINNQTVWDSKKIFSNSMQAKYDGKPLKSRDQVIWQVTLWDGNDIEGEASEATFEIGLINKEDWQAKWISGDYRVSKKCRYPVDCFCKSFIANNIVKARLYITACGIYQAQINNEIASDFVLAPGVTDYNKRLQYQVYNVLPLIKSGKNTLSVQLADGWYRGSVGAWGLTCQYGKQTKLLAQLELTDNNGNKTIITSDKQFLWSSGGGELRFADNKDGEIIDNSSVAVFDKVAKEVKFNIAPSASNNVFVKEKEHFKPQLIVTPCGNKVLDFSQNIAGYMSFTVNAKSSQVIKLRFGEMLDSSGEFTQKNIQCSNKKKTTPLQQIIFTTKDGVNDYKTKFAIFGFRYVLIETEISINPQNFTAIAVYSDMADTLEFDSSNQLLNKFVEATKWSAKGNSADVPTDCPTRERHAWTGDAQIFFNTAAYMLDYATFAKKYVKDLYDWQKPNGKLPQIAPAGGVDFYMAVMNGSVGWADAGVLIPYRYYKIYGDKSMLVEFYDGMKNYADFMITRCGKNALLSNKHGVKGTHKKFIVNKGQAYGEWAEPADVCKMSWKDFVFPPTEVATAYTAYVLGLMQEIANILNKPMDAKRFEYYSTNVKTAYGELVKQPKFLLDTDRQARLVRPLALNLLQGEQKSYAQKRLLKALENYDFRLGTGFLSTPLILDVLAEIDIEYAYRLLQNQKMPGWLYMPKNGATTIWESWEGTNAQGGIASLNHYSKGACCEWLFRVMCGIEVNGENNFAISPKPGGGFTHAKTSYQSIYGKVESGWKIENGKTVYNITIPANCRAKITLPNLPTKTVTTGNYEYVI